MTREKLISAKHRMTALDEQEDVYADIDVRLPRPRGCGPRRPYRPGNQRRVSSLAVDGRCRLEQQQQESSASSSSMSTATLSHLIPGRSSCPQPHRTGDNGLQGASHQELTRRRRPKLADSVALATKSPGLRPSGQDGYQRDVPSGMASQVRMTGKVRLKHDWCYVLVGRAVLHDGYG